MKASGVFSKRSYAFLTVPPIPLAGSVRINSAPNARIVTLLSKLVYEGIVNTILYPFKAAMNAILIPMFPEVGSINTV
ncbi:hypothetical protein HanIR_Chr06g0264821 [Helianthus annuus]|nr:hypothetical protein HanIR_Chr06g0264821 [Helianthus annuus]